MNGILLVLSISIYKNMKRNDLPECKPRIEKGKMEDNGPGISSLDSLITYYVTHKNTYANYYFLFEL